jgi:hypothetical protein
MKSTTDSITDSTTERSQDVPNVEAIAALLHRRQLATPLLLLLASHRPLTFVAGQLLYLLAPLGALLGWVEIDAWAALLSAPDAHARLSASLDHQRTQSH